MKNLEPILLDERTDRSELQLLQLKQRREESYSLLEALRVALEKLLGEAPDLHQIEQFIRISDEKSATIEALKTYMKVKQIDLDIDLNSGFQSVRLPGEVKTLVDAWQALNWHSPEDFSPYWSQEDFAFQPLPINPEEEAKIRERNRVYGTQELNEMYQHLRINCNLINFYRRENPTLPFDAFPKVWQPFLNRDDKGNFTVKESEFLTPGETYQAFDER
ncbi:MAG: hypothetical protein ACK4TA_00155 [Saprospiraceae bacterium]